MTADNKSQAQDAACPPPAPAPSSAVRARPYQLSAAIRPGYSIANWHFPAAEAFRMLFDDSSDS